MRECYRIIKTIVLVHNEVAGIVYYYAMGDLSFSEEDFHELCDALGKKDKHLRQIISDHGYPPLWSRPEGFATLVHIILEQQVSLASARAAYDKLREMIGVVTPKKVLALTDEELKACYFSRQKIVYVRDLAESILDGRVKLKRFHQLPNEEIRRELIAVKGIGHWTADVYLMMVMHRSDLFPMGDIALVNSAKVVKDLPKETTKEEIEKLSLKWRPNRTVAAFLLWHAYIIRKNMKVAPYV
ncbi:MAG: DNA-3-methyladenine glycosylase 2 family protein [Bacteroidetes bacterium]|nr:DNA-3-methyladenine glycosylase 2 family protein [Bacteroidota bacterium]